MDQILNSVDDEDGEVTVGRDGGVARIKRNNNVRK
jgi:hypothetical protein